MIGLAALSLGLGAVLYGLLGSGEQPGYRTEPGQRDAPRRASHGNESSTGGPSIAATPGTEPRDSVAALQPAERERPMAIINGDGGQAAAPMRSKAVRVAETPPQVRLRRAYAVEEALEGQIQRLRRRVEQALEAGQEAGANRVLRQIERLEGERENARALVREAEAEAEAAGLPVLRSAPLAAEGAEGAREEAP